MSSVCDYFIVAGGTSTTHVRALSDNITKSLKEKGQPVRHIEGEREASWILLDFGDVVCHLFLKETRAFYDLEGLWAGAPQERFEEPKPGKRIARKRPARGVKIKRKKKSKK